MQFRHATLPLSGLYPKVHLVVVAGVAGVVRRRGFLLVLTQDALSGCRSTRGASAPTEPSCDRDPVLPRPGTKPGISRVDDVRLFGY
jgi:hypothetical protein